MVIPKQYRDTLGLKEGDELLVWKEDDRLILLPVSKFGTATKGIAKGTYGRTKEEIDKYIEEERESWE